MDFLKEFLGEELYINVKDALKGKDVEIVNLKEGNYIKKELHDTVLQEKENYKTQLSEVNSKLGILNNQLSGQENLQATVTTLQDEIAKKENLLKETTKKYKIKDAIRSFNAKDPEDIFFKLDLEKIKDDEGKITGLEEQILPLKESKGYLFNDEIPSKGGSHLEHSKEQEKLTMNDLIRGRR